MKKNDGAHPIDISKLVSIYEELTGVFHNLVKAASLDPQLDFKNRDLRGLNFADAIIDGFDFSESDLRGTNIRGAQQITLKNTFTDSLLDEDDRVWLREQLYQGELPRKQPRAAFDKSRRTRINRGFYASVIETELLSDFGVIECLENTLAQHLSQGILDANNQQLAKCSTDLDRVKSIVRTLLYRLDFADTLEVLNATIKSCSGDLKKEQILFTVLCWFLPACFNLQKSEEVRRLYEQGNVSWIEANVATPLAAEIIMAAADERAAAFSCDHNGKAVGAYSIPLPPLGLGGSRREELFGEIGNYLVNIYCKTLEYRIKPSRIAINEFLESAARLGQGMPYLLIGGEVDNSDSDRENLRKCAKEIKSAYPHLPILHLTDLQVVRDEEVAKLFSLTEILKANRAA